MCTHKGTHSMGHGLAAAGQASLTRLQEPLLCAPGVWALGRRHLRCASGLLARPRRTENREAALSRRKGVRDLGSISNFSSAPRQTQPLWPPGLLTGTREGANSKRAQSTSALSGTLSLGPRVAGHWLIVTVCWEKEKRQLGFAAARPAPRPTPTSPQLLTWRLSGL